jgi:CheY-like chemotaxis protein
LNLIKATSGNEALGLLLEHDFALLLLDVQMPEMDGFEVADLIQQDEKNKHIPIIFLTAISKEDAHVFKGYRSGAVDYLFKPFDPYILQSKVSVFLELDRQKRELKELNQQKEQLIIELKKAAETVQSLSGLIPICSACKKIREDNGYWNSVENFVEKHSDALFSHSICPDCTERLYGNEEWYKKKMKKKEQ